MKYLKLFQTQEEYDAFLESEAYVIPNVSLVKGSNSIKYNVLLGVFIQHVDGSLYTTDDWIGGGFANDKANGVAVITPNASFVMAPNRLSGKQWSSDTSTVVNGVAVASTAGDAALDLDGKSNTAAFIAENAGTSTAAAPSCANYVFPNGANGYLPSLGELKIAHAHKDEVDAALTVIGSTAASEFWSSTQASADKAWTLNWKTGAAASKTKSYSDKLVRPFTSL